MLQYLIILLFLTAAFPAGAAIVVQCPGDTNGDAIPEPGAPGYDPAVKCAHLSAGDGFARMADGKVLYSFGFRDVTGKNTRRVMTEGMLGAQWPGPTLAVDEGDKFYLSLSNVGMLMRPDLFDPHTVHWHGFPQAASIFDGVPDVSISINMGGTLTYFYNVVEPGTYIYHCHVEATEHMEMGMLGTIYVRPAQNKLTAGTNLLGFTHQQSYKYVYGEYPLQLAGVDSLFHEEHIAIQPLPFYLLRDDYPLINGRGYPDTVNPAPLPGSEENMMKTAQAVSSLITATAGQKILLRLSNVSVSRYYTLASPSIPMKVVGSNARILRGPDGKDLSYTTSSVTIGGGEMLDAILDTTGVPPGTYMLYTANLHMLSNKDDENGGMMTEIRIQ